MDADEDSVLLRRLILLDNYFRFQSFLCYAFLLGPPLVLYARLLAALALTAETLQP